MIQSPIIVKKMRHNLWPQIQNYHSPLNTSGNTMTSTLLSFYDSLSSDYQNNNSTASNTSVASTVSSTGDKLVSAPLSHAKSDRSSNGSQHHHHSHFLTQQQQQQHHHHHSGLHQNLNQNQSIFVNHKMSGGVRRTVSSATASNGAATNGTVRPSNAVAKTLSNSSQSAQCRLTTNGHQHISSKDSHKKLDRSFSEPAEKKNSSSTSALGPSSRYKTELCRSFAEVGSCKYGDKCQFAHGDEELRTITRHPKFKTENCKSFHSTGFCPYGPRCHFIHNSDESKKSMLNNLPNNVSPAVVNQQRLFESAVSPMSVSSNLLHNSSSTTTPPVAANTNPHGLPTSFGNGNPSPTTVLGNVHLVRPKALSIGSYSLDSAGEVSPPSSLSGSPTSLISFFSTEDNFGFGTPFGLSSGSNSRLSSTAVTAFNSGSSTFSFSPDSAFVSFNSAASANTNNSGSMSFNSNIGANSPVKCLFGGSQPALCSRYSPEPPGANETASSVILSLFRHSPNGTTFGESPMNDFLPRSPLGSRLLYPSSPESPVDSVASEIEALKLNDPPLSFTPISTSSSLSSTCASPPNGIDLATFPIMSAPDAVTNCTNIPRLPTFAKFATTGNGTGSMCNFE